MFIQIAPRVKVFVTEEDMLFIKSHSHESFRSDQLSAEDGDRAKRLADKAIFVRKKIDTGVQYALNTKIRISNEYKQVSKTDSPSDRLGKR